MERSGKVTAKGRTRDRIVSHRETEPSVAGMMGTFLGASVLLLQEHVAHVVPVFFSALLEISRLLVHRHRH